MTTFRLLVLTGLAWLLTIGPATTADYGRDVWSPLHQAPAAGQAKNEQCLTCHTEILKAKPLAKSPSGKAVQPGSVWYQSLATYQGAQETFHARHLITPYAKAVMNLSCSDCHLGHDPREKAAPSAAEPHSFTLRKTVNPEKTCLMCHGKFPSEPMGLSGDWSELRESMESDGVKNGCLTCHAEQFRTNRHQVTYLNAKSIEELAQAGSDVCYGCHGGRAWYRISYPYPRHPWPGMPDEIPDWAKDRPSQSDPRFLLGGKSAKR